MRRRLMDQRVLLTSFKYSVPVMAGYLFLGMSFGVFLDSYGYNWIWSLAMSVFIYAGSMQFVAVYLLANQAPLLEVALIAIVINARQLVYGISMLSYFHHFGWQKPYQMLSLTDETFSLLCHIKIENLELRKKVFLGVSLLNQMYWVLGCVLGSLFGNLIPAKGIEFMMTALFIVIFIDRWEKESDHTSSITGIVISLLALVILGKENFIMPTIVMLIIFLLLMKPKLESSSRSSGD